MKRYALSLSAFAALWLLTAPVRAALTTNSWVFTASSGKWEAPSNWSTGAPTNSNAANLITNATTKTVTIDATTTNAANFTTLTISNLVLQGFGSVTNRLQLTSAGTNIPLRILNNLTVGTNAVLVVTNSALEVQGVSGGDFTIDGSVTNLAGGQIITTNASLRIGTTNASHGACTISGGLVRATNVTVGSFSGSQCTLTIAGSGMLEATKLTVCTFTNQIGSVWITGGTLVVTNFAILSTVGNQSASGQLTLSNGAAMFRQIQVSGNPGTMTIAGGTNQVETSTSVGAGGAGETGTVWMTGGHWSSDSFGGNGNALLIGEAGAVGSVTLSNGTARFHSVRVGNGGLGTMTQAGGTNQIITDMILGNAGGSTGAVWVTGGLLDPAGTNLTIGSSSFGQFTLSNGTIRAGSIQVGGGGDDGVINISGGTAEVSNNITLGSPIAGSSAGTMWMNSGHLVVTNGSLILGKIGPGLMTLSNGLVEAINLTVGSSGGGTFTMAGGTNSLSGNFTLGVAGQATGTVWMAGGRLVATNGPVSIGVFADGQMTISNGVFLAGAMRLGTNTSGVGTLTVNGGTGALNGPLRVGVLGTGTVWVTGGQLVITNSPALVGAGSGFVVDGSVVLTNGSSINVSNVNTVVGNLGSGSLDVGRGALNLDSTLIVGALSGSTGTVSLTLGGRINITSGGVVVGSNGVGTVTQSGGTNQIVGTLIAGFVSPASGTLTLSGGQLVASNNNVIISRGASPGQLTQSGGSALLFTLAVGRDSGSQGTFSLSGGTNQVLGGLTVAQNAGSTGAVWMTGGRLVVTNGVSSIGGGGVGQLTLSNGTWLARDTIVGNLAGSQGTLTVAGGTNTVSTSLTLGVTACSATGTVVVAGGRLFVTNAAATAVLEVRSGTLTLNSGTLSIDKLVMTNACGHFVKTGGTLILNTNAVLGVGLDADGDGLPNDWEQLYGLDPLDATGINGASGDFDGDGFTNLQEFNAGTNPNDADSNPNISSWIKGLSGKWELATEGILSPTNWSLVVPPASNQSIFITNALGKIVSIDASTALSNTINGCMTISNLEVRGPSATVNTLRLLNATNSGTVTPLRILSGFTLGTNAFLMVSNAAVEVRGVSGGDFTIDGSVTNHAGGQIIVTNSAITIGSAATGRGNFTMAGGLLLGTNATVGGFAGSQGTLTVAGGAGTFAILDIAVSGSTGAVWVTGGQLTVTNGFGFVDVGVGGVGQMTVSNGTWLARDVGVGPFSPGTLTIAGGTNKFTSLFTIGGVSGATGTLWMTGGQLVTTNFFTRLSQSGVGSVTLSNGTWLARDILVGALAGARGTLTVAGGTNALSGPLIVGDLNATGSVQVTDGLLVVTNTPSTVGAGSGFIIDGKVTVTNGSSISVSNLDTVVGNVGSGSLTVFGGSMLVSSLTVGNLAGSQGTLAVAGGITTLSGALTAGSLANATGAVWVTGGQLVIANNSAIIGDDGVGQMTVSNGTVLASTTLIVALSPASRGVLTVSGGTLQLLGGLLLSDDLNATGQVFVTGGQVIVTNGLTRLGDFDAGYGELTVSNGTLLARNMMLGGNTGNPSKGAFTVAGGTNLLSSFLIIGSRANSTGSVFVSGGLLIVTNAATVIGSNGVGQVTQSGGTTLLNSVGVGLNAGAQGTLTVAGGTSSVFSNLTIGNFPCSPTGTVIVAGGNLFVTNAAVSAVLEVRTGSLILNSGLLTVDKFVMTNACGQFVHSGGTLIYGTAVLDPNRDDDGDGISNGYEQSHGLDPLNSADANIDTDGDGSSNLQEFQAGTDATNSASAFRITAIVKTNIDIRVTWMMGTGKTNALERSTGTGTGSYSNNFAAIFTVTNTVGATTNYLDIGAATNFPSRYYRIRLVP